jgi:hypothetical protein
MSQNVT